MTQSAQEMDQTNAQEFAFVIPVYNHSKSISGVVQAAKQFGFPVIVVDDGSDEDTKKILNTLRGVVLLQHGTNRGKGAALLTGMNEAAKTAKWAITLDADGQHNPQDAAALIAEAKKPPRGVIVGNRRGMLGPHIPWTSRFGRGFSNFWVRASGGPRVSDTQSGYRIYPLPDVLTWGSQARRFQWEVEILVLAHWHNIPVREVHVSVNYEPKGVRISHFRPWLDFWRNSATFTGLIFRRIFIPRRVRSRLLPPP